MSDSHGRTRGWSFWCAFAVLFVSTGLTLCGYGWLFAILVGLLDGVGRWNTPLVLATAGMSALTTISATVFVKMWRG